MKYFDLEEGEEQEKKDEFKCTKIYIKEWHNKQIHYEFFSRKQKTKKLKKGFNIAIHIEISGEKKEKYKKLGETLKEISENLDSIQKKIIFNSEYWGIGSLEINFGEDYNLKEVSETMRLFINLTKKEIGDSIKQIEDEQKK